MRAILAVVLAVVFLAVPMPALAWWLPQCEDPMPVGMGYLPVRFTLDGVPRAQVRVSLLGTSVPDQITGEDGRALFFVPYGCYEVYVEFGTEWGWQNYQVGPYVLLPDGLRIWYDVKVSEAWFDVHNREYGGLYLDSNPEAVNKPRETVLPDCSTGPWPEGRGALLFRVFLNNKPQNGVLLRLIGGNHPDVVTDFDGFGEAGWARFDVPFGCYEVTTDPPGTPNPNTIFSIRVLPSGMYSGISRVFWVGLYRNR